MGLGKRRKAEDEVQVHVLGRCGIDIRGRSRKLRLNYRTTEQTRRWTHGTAGRVRH